MKPANRFADCFMKWKAFSALLGLLLAPAALATEAVHVNNDSLYYTIPGNPPPQIDAFAFDNEDVYSITRYDYINNQVQFSEPWWNTRCFTNNGVMMVNAPIPTNSGFLFLTTGVGFQFDTQTNATLSNIIADTFYNPGSIHCDSVLDGNNVFGTGLFGTFIQTGIGELVVSATNIINPGEVVVSPNGLVTLTGTNVDLTSSVLTMEGATANTSANVAGTGDFGLNTNLWDPSEFLRRQFCRIGLHSHLRLFVPAQLDGLFQFRVPSPNYTVIRSVFIEDYSGSNVAYNVYFDTAGIGFGSGNVTIEWIGSYLDATSGNTPNNYLYLNDNYDLSGYPTNNAIGVNGIPINFTFTESHTRLVPGTPAPAGFVPVFLSGSVTNGYAFANAQLISTSVATNASIRNPSGALTNLPGRIQITAGRDLDLTIANITGPNYLSIQSPHQFEGSSGAQIVSPYSDINVGVTNGFLTISNLATPVIPNWGGTVQAWSTRWIAVVTNGIGTNAVVWTNDYRVLIVGSQLTPTTLAYVQDLILHGTNSLVLSDTFNVLRKLSVDAQNLTLATNGPGNGATSVDGELNLFSSILWSGAFPNLVNLTNYGAIRVANPSPVVFGVPVYVTNGIPSSPPVAATNMLSELLPATNVTANSLVIIGTNQYMFVKTPTNSVPNQVKIAPNFDSTLTNLIAAINHSSGSNTVYSSNTLANPSVAAGLLAGHSFMVTARQLGSIGNSIVTTTTSTNLTWSNPGTLTGGADTVTGSTNIVFVGYGSAGAFINHSLVTDFGATLYVTNFESDGVVSNGSLGSFTLQSQTATFTNGTVYAGANITIAANSLLVSNVAFQAGRGLTLRVTNQITDGLTNGGVWTNGNFWSVGTTNGTSGNGLALTALPATGDLLGTTITNYVGGPSYKVNITWAGQDRGVSTTGYTNDAAVGHLILDALGSSSTFQFNGVGVSNAMYVDWLDLEDFAVNHDISGNFTALTFATNVTSPNLVIYYARATVGGVDIADKMNHKNGDHLRWVPQYTGYFSATNIVYPDGTTNTLNASLIQSTTLDSNGNGIANAFDPSPIFTSNQWHVVIIPPNAGNTNTATFEWHSIPAATNVIQAAGVMPPYVWQVLTNFVSPTNVPPVGGWPITNVVFYQFTGAMTNFGTLGVWVYPNSTSVYGP